MPDPILVGRNAEKVEALAKQHGVARWTTDLDAALADQERHVFFDDGDDADASDAADQGDRRRQAHLLREADRHQPRPRRWRSCRLAKAPASSTARCRTSCSCPACRSSSMLRDSGFFGRILSVRGEFGYWVFEGDWQPAQRPSWNYRTEDGGGIILDMVCHWRYVLDNLFGNVKSVSLHRRHPHSRARRRGGQALQGDRRRCCLCHLPARGRRHRPYQHVLGDARLPRRSRDLPGRRHARLGRRRPHRLHDPAAPGDAAAGVEPRREADHRLLRQLAEGARQRQSTRTASRRNGRCSSATSSRTRRTSTPGRRRKGVQLVECALQSWKERRWVDVPPLKI